VPIDGIQLQADKEKEQFELPAVVESEGQVAEVLA
jgi:hypothetical protein